MKNALLKLKHNIEAYKIKRKHKTVSCRPVLASANADIVRCFDAAVHNAADINTVPCVCSVYNSTGLLHHPFMIRAGGNYHTPWTRDAAINTWQAMRLLNPQVARTTLLAVCTLNKENEPVIQPDVKVWDQIVWAIGAWSYYLATGDEDFLTVAHGIIGRALEFHRQNRFNEKYRLFIGGSFFNDGISGYPIECHDRGIESSFAPDHSVVETIMCLSTNCLFCEAYRIYSEISLLLGKDGEAETARGYHEEFKADINRIFWNDDLGRYCYILYTDGHTDDSQELGGHAFAVLFDICPEGKQSELLKKLVISDCGAVSVYPPFEGLFSVNKPGRHNNLIWPFLNGLLIQAAAKCGLHSLLGEELDRITALYKDSRFEMYEIYSPYTGKAFGGWQTGRKWDSCHNQTWSATCYIGAIIHGIFGINTVENGISFSPCVPADLENCELKNLEIHGVKLNIKIHGYGTKIKEFVVNGKESEAFIPWSKGNNTVEIRMNDNVRRIQ